MVYFFSFKAVTPLENLTAGTSRITQFGQIIATSHDLTPNGGLVREFPLFQGNLGWWNIIIWPDPIEKENHLSIPPGFQFLQGGFQLGFQLQQIEGKLEMFFRVP